jgi:two-component system, NarL family, response regulator DevR
MEGSILKEIRILLVEDDPFWQKRLQTDLNMEDDMEVVGVAASREQAKAAAGSAAFDIVLLDINLSRNQLDGLDVARDFLKNKQVQTKVIMLTSLTDRDVIIKSFQNGAVNFINKSSYADIVRTVRDVYHGIISIHPDASLELIKEVQLSILTPVEREVYHLKQKGFTREQIANKLFKSINTIKTQIRSIKNKLNDEEERE